MSSSDILDELAAQKVGFVNRTRSSVYSYIRQQHRRELVRIVEKNAYGPGVDSYIIVLGRFCAEKRYNEHDLDSVLTDPVVEIVYNCYFELLQRNSNEETLKIVMDELSAKGLKLSQVKLATLIHGAMSQAILHVAHSKLGIVVEHGVTVAADPTAGIFLANMLVKAIAHPAATITAHNMSNTMAAKKVCVVVVVTAIVVKALATKLGITSVGSAMGVIGWSFIGGYLLVKLAGLPEEMTEKVSDGISDTLNDTNKPCLVQILNNLTESASDPKNIAGSVTSGMMDLTEFKREPEKGVDFSNKDIPILEKDVKESKAH